MTPLRRRGGGEGAESGDEARERSAAEREAARLERERRRAEREGRDVGAVQPAPELQPAPEPAPEPESESAPPEAAPAESVPALEPEPAAFEPEPEPAPASAPLPDAEPDRWETPPPAPEVHDPEPHAPDTGEHDVHEPETRDHDAPVGVRRVGGATVRDLPEVSGPRPPVPGSPSKLAGPRRRRRGGRRVLGLLLLLVMLAAIAWFAVMLLQPFADDGDSGSRVSVTIPRGATADDIGELLADRDVIDSSFFFGLRARIWGRRDDLKAGRFTLRTNMSYAAVLGALTRNPEAAPTVAVTIPEGRSFAEAAPLVRATTLTGSYVKAATRNPRSYPGTRGYGAPKGTKTLEGFLFPASYELKRGSSAGTLVSQQIAAFRRAYEPLDTRGARRLNLTDYDVLIIASMIEREAGTARDRRLISAVIANRLEQRIPLGIDATLRYRLNNWSRPLRVSELETDSAFNTRLRQGLPPTPIGSPGLASLKAALDPANVDYLFYVVKPCGNGAHAFSTTDAEFQKDVAAYNRKREQLGGKDPSRC